MQQNSEEWNKLVTSSKTIFTIVSMAFAMAFALTCIPGVLPAGSSILLQILTACSGVFMVMGGSFLTAEITKRPLLAFTNALSPYSEAIIEDPDSLKYKTLHTRYLKMKEYIGNDNIDHLDYYFRHYKHWLYDSSDPSWKPIVLRMIIQYLEFAFVVLEQPQITTPRNVSKAEIETKAKALQEILDTYPEQKEAMSEFARNIGYYQMRGTGHESIKALYLVGPPGVGKTTIIQAICDLYEAKLTILKGKSCVSYNNGTRQFWEALETHKASPLCQALYASHSVGKTGYKVLFFDEVDKFPLQSNGGSGGLPTLQEVSQNLLELTDNDQTRIKDPYSGMHCPKNQVIVVIAVNDCILKHIPALESRVDKINLGRVSKNTKVEIAGKKLILFSNRLKVEQEPELIDTVNNMATSNKKPGVREMVGDIKGLVHKLEQQSFYEGTSLGRSKKDIFEDYSDEQCSYRCNVM
jgi:hypothetical protein